MTIHSLYFQICRQNLIFVDIIANVWSRRKENSSEIPVYGIYRSVKLFSSANQIAKSIILGIQNYNQMVH